MCILVKQTDTQNVSSSRILAESLKFKLPRLHHSIRYYFESHDHVRIH